MVAPRTGEHMKLYLSATPQTASAVLVVEREGPVLHNKSATTPKPKLPDEELDKGTGPTNPPPVPEPKRSLPQVNLHMLISQGGLKSLHMPTPLKAPKSLDRPAPSRAL